MRLKPFLQLIRIPNVFTAAADSLAGWLLCRGALEDPAQGIPLVLASACVYAGGITLNDAFDVETDRAERPGRPLPSGSISLRFAWILGWGLLLAGLLLILSGRNTRALPVGLALVGCVVAYNAGAKRTPLGPAFMGACRGLNLLLGLAMCPAFGGPGLASAALLYALFVAGITWISRSEVAGASRSHLVLGMALEGIALCGLVVLAATMGLSNTSSRVNQFMGVGLLVAAAMVLFRQNIKAYSCPDPGKIQQAIKTAILALIWLHVGLLLALRGPGPAIMVALLWPPAAFAGRWIYST